MPNWKAAVFFLFVSEGKKAGKYDWKESNWKSMSAKKWMQNFLQSSSAFVL